LAGVTCRPGSAAGDRGAVSPSAHDETRARPLGPAVSAAQHRDKPAQSIVGHGRDIRLDSQRFVCLAVVLDWFSRCALSWRVSIMMESALCVAVLEEALARCARPEILSTNQGSQFTCPEFTGVLPANDIRISMDGRARRSGASRRDNVGRRARRAAMAQRAGGGAASRPRQRKGGMRVARPVCVNGHNRRRPHSSLDGRTPGEANFQRTTTSPIRLAA
jgi:putative transposase